MPRNPEKNNVIDIQNQISILEKRINELEISIKGNKLYKKANKVKDPNKPKKYNSAYIYFNIEKVNEYKNKYPKTKINVIDIAKEAGNEWKNIKNDERKYEKYKKMEDLDKKRYKKEMVSYEKKTRYIL